MDIENIDINDALRLLVKAIEENINEKYSCLQDKIPNLTIRFNNLEQELIRFNNFVGNNSDVGAHIKEIIEIHNDLDTLRQDLEYIKRVRSRTDRVSRKTGLEDHQILDIVMSAITKWENKHIKEK